jgi:hypothetical protein
VAASNYTCLRLLSSQANLTCRVACLEAYDQRVEARNQARAEAAAAEAHAKAPLTERPRETLPRRTVLYFRNVRDR